MPDIGDATRISSFDPGETTGWCLAEKIAEDLWEINDADQFVDIQDVSKYIEPGDVVIYENIVVQRPGVKTGGIEVIGAIKLVAKVKQARVVQRSPAHLQGPRNWPCDLPLLITEGGYAFRHAKDACYHIMSYLGVDRIKNIAWSR